MRKLFIAISLFFIPLMLHASEKENDGVLLICTKVSSEFVDDLNLDIPKSKSDIANYMLLVWNSNEEPFHLTGDNRFISPANVYIFNGVMYEFHASLFSTVTEELAEVASVLFISNGKTDESSKHGLFYFYNKNYGIYQNIDYISSVGGVYQFDTTLYRNQECEDKFPGVNIEHVDSDSTE